MLPLQPLVRQLKSARKAKGLSQQSLADKLGIPQSHLSKIEAGTVNLKLAGFIEMAHRLDLEVMLIPRQEVLFVKGLVASQGKSEESDEIKPAYTLDKEDEE